MIKLLIVLFILLSACSLQNKPIPNPLTTLDKEIAQENYQSYSRLSYCEKKVVDSLIWQIFYITQGRNWHSCYVDLNAKQRIIYINYWALYIFKQKDLWRVPSVGQCTGKEIDSHLCSDPVAIEIATGSATSLVYSFTKFDYCEER